MINHTWKAEGVLGCLWECIGQCGSVLMRILPPLASSMPFGGDCMFLISTAFMSVGALKWFSSTWCKSKQLVWFIIIYVSSSNELDSPTVLITGQLISSSLGRYIRAGLDELTSVMPWTSIQKKNIPRGEIVLCPAGKMPVTPVHCAENGWLSTSPR